MSSTRRAKPGSPFRQERFASGFKRGLLANLVAKRCEQLSPEECAPIWFLQWLSWQPGGIAAHVQKIYPPAELKLNPVGDLEKRLFETCLDSEFSPGNDPDWRLAAVYREKWIKEHPRSVETEIGRQIADALKYAESSRGLVLVDGAARIGKSFAARSWCERTAGMARYVQVPSSNDDAGFFRAIAQPLGVSCSLKIKAVEIRARVEEALQTSDLMLVLDEAHYLWPHLNWQRYATPSRVNWIMTALVNFKVPTALICTPQFHKAQKRVENQSAWASEQFTGRIGHVEKLPDRLKRDDLLAVARVCLPGSDPKTLGAVAAYAELSAKHLGAIENISRRALWLAQKNGRNSAASGDVAIALRESLQFDPGMNQALAGAKSAPRNYRARVLHSQRGPFAHSTREIGRTDENNFSERVMETFRFENKT